jgi:hypothetical protein
VFAVREIITVYFNNHTEDEVPMWTKHIILVLNLAVAYTERLRFKGLSRVDGLRV